MTADELDHLDNTQEPILVREGQILTLSPGLHVVDRLIVEAGGYLDCRSATGWHLFVVRGDVQIHGKIDLTGAKTRGEISAPLPYEPGVISYRYREGNAGGRGGWAYVWEPQGRYLGRGADGTKEYGGGGGSGSFHADCGSRARGDCDHHDAAGRHGARNPGGAPAGGDGGSRGRAGGLMYLAFKGTLDGTGGVIDVRGLHGTPGDNGEDGRHVRGRRGRPEPISAGGAGGGGPGGSGGIVFVDNRWGKVDQLPRVLLDGGFGGQPGMPGVFHSRDGSRHYSGGPAQVGEPGEPGFFKFPWKNFQIGIHDTAFAQEEE